MIFLTLSSVPHANIISWKDRTLAGIFIKINKSGGIKYLTYILARVGGGHSHMLAFLIWILDQKY